MGNKPWADEETPSPISEFIGSFIAGFLTLAVSVAWIPIKFGMNKWLAMGICAVCALAFGYYMAKEAKQKLEEKKKK